MSSVYDDVTVVGGPSRNVADHGLGKSTDKNGSPLKQGFDRKTTAGFVDVVDYMQESRPFVVPIGRDGLIAALGKLDQRLKEVSGIRPRY